MITLWSDGLNISSGFRTMFTVLVFNLRATDSKQLSFWVSAETVNKYYMSMKLVCGSTAISLQQIALTYLKLIQRMFWWKEIDHNHTMAVFSLSQTFFSNSISFLLLLMALNWYVNLDLMYWSFPNLPFKSGPRIWHITNVQSFLSLGDFY